MAAANSFLSRIWYLLLTVAPFFVPDPSKNKGQISEAATRSCSVKNFARKIPVLKSLFNRVAGLEVCNFIKERLQPRRFLMEFAKFLRTPILKNICERLVLKTVLSPGVLFFVTYTSGSNWYICFSYCIIIYSLPILPSLLLTLL